VIVLFAAFSGRVVAETDEMEDLLREQRVGAGFGP
jgi:hypothetical protein